MKIIPVIDLMHGQVVHAREGRREEYRSLRSKLCKGAGPEAVVGGLLGLHPFRVLYVADLDAIRREGDHLGSLRRLRRRFPDLELWVDSGISGEDALADWMREGVGRPVIGSESLADPDMLRLARERCRETVLSLDFAGEEFKGPGPLLTDPRRYWPGHVLAMNLWRVGSDAGPDVGLIAKLCALAPDRAVYAAGGVRSRGDLQAVAAAGAAGALIASAFHDGRLGRADLARLAFIDREL
ncbi:MAG: HisA/HisF-related TIM barrel protein [Burkholderiales bacterium]